MLWSFSLILICIFSLLSIFYPSHYSLWLQFNSLHQSLGLIGKIIIKLSWRHQSFMDHQQMRMLFNLWKLILQLILYHLLFLQASLQLWCLLNRHYSLLYREFLIQLPLQLVPTMCCLQKQLLKTKQLSHIQLVIIYHQDQLWF